MAPHREVTDRRQRQQIITHGRTVGGATGIGAWGRGRSWAAPAGGRASSGAGWADTVRRRPRWSPGSSAPRPHRPLTRRRRRQRPPPLPRSRPARGEQCAVPVVRLLGSACGVHPAGDVAGVHPRPEGARWLGRPGIERRRESPFDRRCRTGHRPWAPQGAIRPYGFGLREAAASIPAVTRAGRRGLPPVPAPTTGGGRGTGPASPVTSHGIPEYST